MRWTPVARHGKLLLWVGQCQLAGTVLVILNRRSFGSRTMDGADVVRRGSTEGLDQMLYFTKATRNDLDRPAGIVTMQVCGCGRGIMLKPRALTPPV